MQAEVESITKPDEINVKAEFDLREKRLGLVYKILYVSAAVWISLMLSFVKNIDFNNAPVYCALLSLTTVFIICIGRYVFGELRCLQVSSVVDKKLKETADKRFSDIWNSIGFYAILAGIFMYVQTLFPTIFTRTFVMIYLSVGGVGSGISPFLKNDNFRIIVNSSCCMLACYSFFALCQVIIKSA
jgi:hypothetical protein